MNLKSVPEAKRDLRAHTTIKIGGRADKFFYVSTLDELLSVHREYGDDFYLLGGGSNLLVTDNVLSRPVIKFKGDLCGFTVKGDIVEASGGALFSQVLKDCMKASLGGLESLVGIPATIGGMLVMNAGAFKHTISDFLEEVEVFDSKKNVKVLLRDKLEFGYRSSSLKGKIVLRARFKLHEDKFVRDRANDFLRERVARQDYEHPSFGSVFKNPQGFSAGQLVDSCGLKGLRQGGAQISPRHANFIINLGNATCKDVEYLIGKAKSAVQEKHNIILEEEVVRWI